MQAISEDPRPVLEIEVHQVAARKARSSRVRAIRRCQPEREQAAGRGPGDQAEAVREAALLPRLRRDQLLEAGNHPRSHQAADPAPLDREDSRAVRARILHRSILLPLGAWRSLVARTVRVGEVPGSNPGAPISSCDDRRACMAPPPRWYSALPTSVFRDSPTSTSSHTIATLTACGWHTSTWGA